MGPPRLIIHYSMIYNSPKVLRLDQNSALLHHHWSCVVLSAETLCMPLFSIICCVADVSGRHTLGGGLEAPSQWLCAGCEVRVGQKMELHGHIALSASVVCSVCVMDDKELQVSFWCPLCLNSCKIWQWGTFLQGCAEVWVCFFCLFVLKCKCSEKNICILPLSFIKIERLVFP